MDRRLGRTVLNYRIEEKLGEGSFGIVYRARHIDLDRDVAIKVLRAEHSRDRGAVQRFLREAKLVCTIGHPAIVQVENSGMLDDDEPFYVMELVSGRSLARVLADDGPLTASQLAIVFGEVAEALAAAHAKGVIHRDLKPHNLMITEEAGAITGVKLCDFGIAKLLDSADSGSQTGGMMGTPHFMAPEQARDAKGVDERADVYGFAATFFAAATGHRPFEGDSVTEVLIAVQQDPPPPLSQFLPAAPAALVAIVDRCLAKTPADRPRTVREAADAILAQLARMPPSARATRGAARPPRVRGDVAATMTSGPTGATGAPASVTLGSTEVKGSIDRVERDDRDGGRRRRRGLAIAAMTAAIAAAGAITYAARRRGDETGGSGPVSYGTAIDAPIRVEMPPPPIAPPDAAPSIVLAPPDAAEVTFATPDAAPPHRPDHAHRPTPTPHTPPPRKPPIVATPTVPGPTTPAAPAPPSNCAKADFAAIYEALAPDAATVRAALRHVKACRDAGVISAAEFDRYQTALVAKL